MGMNNVQLYQLASRYIGTSGGDAKRYCGLRSGDPYCSAFVTWLFHKGDDSNLWYGGRKVVYVPSAESWCRANLAEIPMYLSMPMDVITFDWNNNRTPDHIGFVRGRKSDLEVNTIEGNTSGGIVACKTRPHKYVSGIFRPHFNTGKWTTTKALVIDGQFDYNSIACLQLALRRGGYYKGKINAVLDKDTVKALQRKASDGSGLKIAADGSWGMKTSKAIQKWLNIKADGWWGAASTKSLQRWINQYNEWYAKKHKLTPQTKPTPSIPVKPVVVKKDIFDKANAWAEALCKSPNGKYKVFGDDPKTQECPICHKDAYYGYNCIGAAFAYWRHGAGIPCRCNCEVINDNMMDRLLRSNHETAVKLVQQCTGLTQVTVVSNGGKAVPVSALKKGDLIIYYEGNDSAHMGVHIGNGRLFDCARGHTPQMQCGQLGVDWWTKENGWQVKIVIRYTGKITV